jgi:hypothetical protein
MHLSVPDVHHDLLSAGRGFLIRNGKEGAMIIIVITVVAVMSLTVTITVRVKRR